MCLNPPPQLQSGKIDFLQMNPLDGDDEAAFTDGMALETIHNIYGCYTNANVRKFGIEGRSSISSIASLHSLFDCIDYCVILQT